MPRFDIQGFGDVESTIKPVPAGKYKCQITKCEERDSKSSSNKYLNWTFTIVDGSDYQGRSLFFMTMLSPANALFKLKKLCESIGSGCFDANSVDTDAMIGQEVMAKVVLTTNKETGEPQNNVVTVDKA